MRWIVTIERTETTTSRAAILVDAESGVEATKKVTTTETSFDDLDWGDEYTEEGDAEVVGYRAFDSDTEDTDAFDRLDEDIDRANQED